MAIVTPFLSTGTPVKAARALRRHRRHPGIVEQYPTRKADNAPGTARESWRRKTARELPALPSLRSDRSGDERQTQAPCRGVDRGRRRGHPYDGGST